MKGKITIYTNKNCSFCEQTKVKFKEKGIKFIEKPTIDWKKEWHETIFITGMATTPTILYNNTYFVPNRDFQSPDQLIELLNSFKDFNINNNKLILEKIKTLNYNIMMMLHNLNAELKQVNTNLNKEENGNKSTS